MAKTSTIILRDALTKRDELRRNSYWHQQIPERCPPVLWFGDHRNKPLITTVGLNPSHGEFFRSQEDAKNLNYPSSDEQRFYVYSAADLQNTEDPSVTNRVIQSYDDYFRRNPYTRWFGKLGGHNVEQFIHQLGASFYGNDSLGCVHIDLFPFVTVDKFSKLDQKRVEKYIFSDPWFLENFRSLIDFLEPQQMILFGKSTVEYFNKYFEGSINLGSEFREGNKKYANYGISAYTAYGRQIPVVGLSVNLGDPRGFTKELLAIMGRIVNNSLKTAKLEIWRSLPFLIKPIPDNLLTLALSHEKNQKLAQLGDAVISLTIRDFYYDKLSADEIQVKNGDLGDDDNLAHIAINLKLDNLIKSSSGLKNNPDINKVYASALEAIIGLIYKVNDLENAKNFTKKWIIQHNKI